MRSSPDTEHELLLMFGCRDFSRERERKGGYRRVWRARARFCKGQHVVRPCKSGLYEWFGSPPDKKGFVSVIIFSNLK